MLRTENTMEIGHDSKREDVIDSTGNFVQMHTRDGSIDHRGRPANKIRTGGWTFGSLILANGWLSTTAQVGVQANLVLFSKYVLGQTNAKATSSVSVWTGTVFLFSMAGAFLSDSYLGGYLTCVLSQVTLAIGLISCSLVTQLSLLNPHGCGTLDHECKSHSTTGMAIFYLSIYLIAIGSGAPQPSLATFGTDQFDEYDPKERDSKNSFMGYFFIATNLGSLVAQTVLVYVASAGSWSSAFWISTCCGITALITLVCGNRRFRYIKPRGNPFSRATQVIVASLRKSNLELPSNGEGLYEVSSEHHKKSNGIRRIPHTDDFKFLDRAAIISPSESTLIYEHQHQGYGDPWRLCTVTQVEEVKCLLRIITIWVCTTMSVVVFIQMDTLFVEQGSAMNTLIFGSFNLPPASMTALVIITSSTFIIIYNKLMKLVKFKPPTELQKIGIGLTLAIINMVVAGIVEQQRRRFAIAGKEVSSLSILWQIPQCVLGGVCVALVYLSQWEFFSSEAPDGMKSMGLALSWLSSAVASYLSGILLSIVMSITSRGGKPGWVSSNLNEGRLDYYFYLSAVLTAISAGLFMVCATRYKSIVVEKGGGDETEGVP